MPRSIFALLFLIPASAIAALPCGNGTVDPGEACDDANRTATDGCSPTCALEPGFACDNGAATNLLVNGGFEAGTTGWATDGQIGTGAHAQDGELVITATPNAYVNADCLSGQCLEGNLGGIIWRQTVTVAPSTTYRFSAFAAVRSDGSATSRLFLRANGADITPVFDEDDQAPAPWVPFGAEFTTGESQTSVVLEVYNAYTQSPGNGFHLDELALVRSASVCAPIPPNVIACGNGAVDTGEACDDANAVAGDGCSSTCTVEGGFTCANAGATNLLVNGGFESGTTGWTTEGVIGTGAHAQDGELVLTASPNAYVNAACLSGQCLEGNLGGVVWRQTVSVTPSTSYRFSAFAAVRSDGSATSRLTLRVEGADITPVFDRDGPAPAPWVPFGAEFTTAVEQTSVRLEVYNAYLQSPGNGFHLDELALVRAPSACSAASTPDAGVVADAGDVPDAATDPIDAGTTPVDAGTTTADAGSEPTIEAVDGGCGCANAGAELPLALALGLLAWRRRRAA